MIEQFPHCDARVLHAPGECEYCDHHPDWQKLREVWSINYTGHYQAGMSLCPAEEARGIDSLEAWGGNRSTVGRLPTPEEIDQAIADLQKARQELTSD